MTVDSTAHIVERLAAAAGHVVAPFALFNPKVAVRALLELFALREVDERRVQLLGVVSELILLAGDTLVVEYLTSEAVMLRTQRALQLAAFLTVFGDFFEDESELTVRGGTPRQVLLSVHYCAQ